MIKAKEKNQFDQNNKVDKWLNSNANSKPPQRARETDNTYYDFI